MSRDKVRSGARSESGSWIERASPGGLQQAGWVQSSHTTCLSTCSQGGGSTCWGNSEELPELCPGWGCCILAREDRGLAGSSVEGEAAGQPWWSWERSRLAGGGVSDGWVGRPGRASVLVGAPRPHVGPLALGRMPGWTPENWENLRSWA